MAEILYDGISTVHCAFAITFEGRVTPTSN